MRAFLDSGACVNVRSPSFLKKSWYNEIRSCVEHQYLDYPRSREGTRRGSKLPVMLRRQGLSHHQCVIIDVSFDLLFGPRVPRVDEIVYGLGQKVIPDVDGGEILELLSSPIGSVLFLLSQTFASEPLHVAG